MITDEDTDHGEYVAHQEDNIQDDGDGGVESGTLQLTRELIYIFPSFHPSRNTPHHSAPGGRQV